MTDTKQHYSDLLNLADSLVDNLEALINKMPPPESTRANWGHIGTMLEFNRSLSEASYYLNKQINFWEAKEAERCSNA
jgi:hypothetical protein